MPSRCILILLDGLGDRSFSCLGGKTPLQAAHTPHLDALAGQGANGLFHADRMGVALPSENAHFSLFGYDRDEFPGRGVLEAMGAGIEVSADDVYILAHLVGVTERSGTLVLQKDRPRAEPSEVSAIVQAIASYEYDGIRFHFRPTHGLDGILTLTGPVSPYVTDTDPMWEGHPLTEVQPWRSFAKDIAAQTTARALKQHLVWCYERLVNHPVNQSRQLRGAAPINAVATQRPGRLRTVQSFKSRWGLRGLSISSGLVYWGLCTFLGMDIVKARETGDIGKDFAERLKLARDGLKEYDLIHVHTKAPDTAAHTKNPHTKKAAIEALDHGLGEALGPLMSDPETLIVVTSDHSTPSAGPLIHSGEPVPIVIAGEGVRRDAIERFDEIHCAGGALGLVRGNEFMYLLLNYLDRAKLRGIMDTPDDQAFWPGDSKPFRVE
ncbi:MAG: alkaline phosphatase family protein [Pseudomonadota bacterium]